MTIGRILIAWLAEKGYTELTCQRGDWVQFSGKSIAEMQSIEVMGLVSFLITEIIFSRQLCPGDIRSIKYRRIIRVLPDFLALCQKPSLFLSLISYKESLDIKVPPSLRSFVGLMLDSFFQDS